MDAELIKIFLTQYKAYNEKEINRLDKEKDKEEITLLWGILHSITATQSFISTIESKE